MTHAELEQLAQTPEGRRRIDAMAAERVMGWVRRTNGDVGGYATGEDVPEHEREYDLRLCEYWWEKLPDGMWKSHGSAEGSYDESAWSPTTSIADAWKLAEKMRDQLPVVSWTGADWKCTFYSDDEAGFPTANAATAPLAITIAALLAVEQKEKA